MDGEESDRHRIEIRGFPCLRIETWGAHTFGISQGWGARLRLPIFLAALRIPGG